MKGIDKMSDEEFAEKFVYEPTEEAREMRRELEELAQKKLSKTEEVV